MLLSRITKLGVSKNSRVAIRQFLEGRYMLNLESNRGVLEVTSTNYDTIVFHVKGRTQGFFKPIEVANDSTLEKAQVANILLSLGYSTTKKRNLLDSLVYTAIDSFYEHNLTAIDITRYDGGAEIAVLNHRKDLVRCKLTKQSTNEVTQNTRLPNGVVTASDVFTSTDKYKAYFDSLLN